MHANLGQIVFMGLVALGGAIGLIIHFATHRNDAPESYDDWLDRQY